MRVSPLPAEWQELSVLYDQAQALAPAERADWLARLEAQAHAQAPCLRRMLSVDGGFLQALPAFAGAGADDPGPDAAAPPDLQCQPRQLIGAYRLLRPLGAGGMAEVWLAERADGAFTREVALKLLTAQGGAARTQNFQRRFEREHRILAALRHEHIAALFDAGVTAEGQHWLALEYVAGQNIAAWCDGQRLSLRQRVALFGQVLQAVAHAHARLVIHRDLKPSNVLVTEAGQVRLLDFGIATLLDDEAAGGADGPTGASDLTRASGQPMTPRYASPEQLQGLSIDASSDVYTLGVMLYELLCGQPPYAPTTRGTGAMALAVLAGEPLPPSQQPATAQVLAARGLHARALRRQLKGELDAIVLRAMARQPAHRYGSADALAADLTRWLQGEPVLARLPGPFERSWKFSRRHPWGTGLGTAAVLALTLATGWAALSARQASEEAARARQASNFMLRLFEDADPDRHGGKAPTPADLLVLGRQRLLADAKAAVSLKSELLESIARAQNEMLEYDAAEETYARWLDLCKAACPPQRSAWALTWRAQNELRRHRLPEAAKWLGQARLAVPAPQAEPALQAKQHEIQAWLAYYEGRLDEAEKHFQRGLQTLPAGADAHHHQRFDLWLGLARNAAQQSLGDHARAALAAAQVELKTLALERPAAVHELARFRSEVFVGLGLYAELQKFAASDLKACERESQNTSLDCRLLLVQASVVSMRLGHNSPAQATALLRVADAAKNEAQRMNALRWAYRAAQETPGAAETAALRSRLMALESSASLARTRVLAMLALAENSLRDRQPDAALQRLAQARQLARQAGPSEAYFGAQVQLAQGLAMLQTGQFAEALRLLQVAQLVIDADLGAAHPLALWLGLNRVKAFCAVGQSGRALALVDEAWPTLLRDWGADAPAMQRLKTLRQQLAGGVQAAPAFAACDLAAYSPFY